MKLEIKEKFNVLISDKLLVSKEGLRTYEEAEESEKPELYKTNIIYVPKTLTLEQLQERYVEVDK